MKQLILIFVFAISIIANAQENATVTLIASGQGKTSVEAKQFALRSAIEQAFGAFISSKTEILNDSLVRDEVSMISSGTVMDYILLNETKLPDNSYSVTLNATVSISRLKKIAESKGEIVSFSGALFGMKIKIAKLQMEAEIKVIKNLCNVSSEILSQSVDYKLEIGEPSKANIIDDIIGGSMNRKKERINEEAPLLVNFNDSNQYKIRVIVENKANKNLDLFIDFFNKTLQSIKMSPSEVEFAKTSNLKYSVFNLSINKERSVQNIEIYLRSKTSHELINKCMFFWNNILFHYKIYSDNNFINFSLLDYEKYKDLYVNPSYPNSYGCVLDLAQELYIKQDFFVNIRSIIPVVNDYYVYWYPDRKLLKEYMAYPYNQENLILQNEYDLFYTDFEYISTRPEYVKFPFEFSFWNSLESTNTLGNEFKMINIQFNWNTRYQVYDFYLPLSELEKINEIKVEPYTTP